MRSIRRIEGNSPSGSPPKKRRLRPAGAARTRFCNADRAVRSWRGWGACRALSLPTSSRHLLTRSVLAHYAVFGFLVPDHLPPRSRPALQRATVLLHSRSRSPNPRSERARQRPRRIRQRRPAQSPGGPRPLSLHLAPALTGRSCHHVVSRRRDTCRCGTPIRTRYVSRPARTMSSILKPAGTAGAVGHGERLSRTEGAERRSTFAALGPGIRFCDSLRQRQLREPPVGVRPSSGQPSLFHAELIGLEGGRGGGDFQAHLSTRHHN